MTSLAETGRGHGQRRRGKLAIGIDVRQVFPFRAADRALAEAGGAADVVLVDMHAEATSEKVAMGWYLDGRVNRRSEAGEPPNENYARELLELHTLGVHGGYTQRDVMEVARALTGYS